jgi:phosphatidylglycerophosphate synthase
VLPQWWSANTVTVVGNIPVFFALLVCIYYGGVRFHNEEGLEPVPELPAWTLILFAFSIQWFDWFDMMDGARARRLKAGSPIGRIIDEAGDLMIYTNIATIGAYCVRAPPGFLCLSYGVINFTSYFMEINFIITGKLE